MELKLITKRLIVKKILRRELPLSLVTPEFRLPAQIKVLSGFVNDGGKIPCNLNFDDLCPKYFDEDGIDFGGDIENGVSIRFQEMLKEYPYIAVTFFIIPDCMSSRRHLINSKNSEGRYDISSQKHGKWLQYYKSLASKYNIEYAMHGLHHWQFENVAFARHAEFAFKRQSESTVAVLLGREILMNAGIEVCGFRQPAWDINSDLSLLGVLKKAGFRYLAGSSPDAGLNAGTIRTSNYFPTIVGDVLNLPQNVALDWDIERIKQEIDKIVSIKGIISVKGHFVNAGMPNCLSSANVRKLRRVLDFLSSEYAGEIEYLTFRQIIERLPDNKVSL